jgi:hypothetical protein
MKFCFRLLLFILSLSSAAFSASSTAVMTSDHAASAEEAQQGHATEYILDDGIGGVALYPGVAYRSFVDVKYRVQSLEDLEGRVNQLPPGTRLHWAPYKRDASSKPILFSKSQYDRFAKFCHDHKIEIIVLPSQPGNHNSR